MTHPTTYLQEDPNIIWIIIRMSIRLLSLLNLIKGNHFVVFMKDDHGQGSPLCLYCETNLAGRYLEEPKIIKRDAQGYFPNICLQKQFMTLSTPFDYWFGICSILFTFFLYTYKITTNIIPPCILFSQLFIQVVRSAHFFLIAIDLHQIDFLIIDNKKYAHLCG